MNFSLRILLQTSRLSQSVLSDPVTKEMMVTKEASVEASREECPVAIRTVSGGVLIEALHGQVELVLLESWMGWTPGLLT